MSDVVTDPLPCATCDGTVDLAGQECRDCQGTREDRHTMDAESAAQYDRRVQPWKVGEYFPVKGDDLPSLDDLVDKPVRR